MLWPHQHAKLAQLAARNGKTIAAKPRPRGENVVDLMDALKKSIAGEASPAKGKKPRKAAAGQKEMLLPIEGKGRAQKKAAKSERATGRRKAGYALFMTQNSTQANIAACAENITGSTTIRNRMTYLTDIIFHRDNPIYDSRRALALAEHWDVLQDEATRAESQSGLPMFGEKFPE